MRREAMTNITELREAIEDSEIGYDELLFKLFATLKKWKGD